ncbi:MAG: hypothetical protein K2M96_08315 [Prevotella sp.]|nr:hypothetical protein [Prevotella sp.]
MKKLFLICLILFGALRASAETWTPVGQVQWTEGALTGQYYYDFGYHKTWNVSVERSDTRPKVFRLQPYASKPFNYSDHLSDNVYVYLHTENPKQVYIEYYKYYYRYSYYFHVWQRCPENGFDSKYYGNIVDGNSIEFPVGSFAVDNFYNTSSSQTAPSSYAKYSTYIHKIVFPEGVLDYTPAEESWVNIGKGRWEDPYRKNNNGDSYTTNVDVEKSVQHPHNYRISLQEGDYIKIYTENPSKVYISSYSVTNSQGVKTVITQNCPENGLSGSQYGTLSNGKITIPGDYFIASVPSTGETMTCDASRKCVITLPDGFDNPLPEENGVFMGIIAFNDEIARKPISLLNNDTKEDFTSFVDGLQMGNATLLYYAVDQAVSSMKSQTFPENLSNAVLVTFTDGLDQGSLAMKPEHRSSKGYASYLADIIGQTTIQGCPLEAYAIGLKSDDVYDDELFMYNLQSIASNDNNISPVSNITEMQQKLTNLFENLNRQTTQRIVTIKVPMMSHGDKYRFTLDKSRNSATSSNVWFEGVFNIDNMSLEDITYHGFTSISGTTIVAKQESIKLLFTLNDCRDLDGGTLDVSQDGIDQWQYIPSRDIWNHNIENAKKEDIDIQEVISSVAIMFALDCSSSLGDLFPLVKSTANSFINRLAGGDDSSTGIEDVVADDKNLDSNAPVEYYDIQGVRVLNPRKGLYIRRQGNTVSKVMIR